MTDDRRRTIDRSRREIARLATAGLAAGRFCREVQRSLERAIPHTSFWLSTIDPATFLYTGWLVRGTPEEAVPELLANEILEPDFNKFTALASSRHGVSTLAAATRGRPAGSPRFRQILTPLGFGEELRAVARGGGATWGAMCLHRDRVGFEPAEVELVRRTAPLLAHGLRAAQALAAAATPAAEGSDDEVPGTAVFAGGGGGGGEDFELVAATPAAERWLAELAELTAPAAPAAPATGGAVPPAVRSVCLALTRHEAAGDGSPPRLRLRLPDGRWLALFASRLAAAGGTGEGRIAVTFQLARPAEVAPLVLRAWGLTRREGELAARVLHGRSTAEIATDLGISPHTVQQHLKAIFEKTGTGSRRELVGRLFTLGGEAGSAAGATHRPAPTYPVP